MNPRLSPSSPFSPTRPSRLILHQCSLSEAQTQLRVSPGKLRLYASETGNNAEKNEHNETDKYRTSSNTYNTPHKAPGLSISKCFSHDANEQSSARSTPSPASSPTNRFWSDLGSWQDRDKVASETTSNLKPVWLEEDSYDSHSLNSIPELWKPPKPRKPSFLTSSGSAVFDNTPNPSENAQYPTYTSLGGEKDQQDTKSSFHGPQFSLSSGVYKPSKICLNVNHARRKQWNTKNEMYRGQARKIIWRPSLRPALYRAPAETYQLPVDDPERPFPMPIPTMDKLPLHWESLKYRSLDGQEMDRSDKRDENLTLHLSKKVFELALVTFSLDEFEHSGQTSESNSLFRVGFRLSVSPLNANSPINERGVIDDAVNLLRLSFAVPALLLRAISLIVITAQSLRSSKVLTTIVRFITALLILFVITIVWMCDKVRLGTVSGWKAIRKIDGFDTK
ncbi:uncharacterized protein EURHEDRAFT_138686 [Aspergillus ruber CBS 135680]|uniref:Uncharacterized protein n=1 Tax=Aspergillus ruber (strain CBS 135680) TaxID=1388766 RepID=A0A017S9X7_ASPRC|nr:uncharacterized protein EURHEDRAFT_138686 [Aspergillus ruber CBS 135680]EYE93591.1 hypothetical protein EURHEDRAFT_138686 [Aspergillus ruber CBS 135680]